MYCGKVMNAARLRGKKAHEGGCGTGPRDLIAVYRRAAGPGRPAAAAPQVGGGPAAGGLGGRARGPAPVQGPPAAPARPKGFEAAAAAHDSGAAPPPQCDPPRDESAASDHLPSAACACGRPPRPATPASRPSAAPRDRSMNARRAVPAAANLRPGAGLTAGSKSRALQAAAQPAVPRPSRNRRLPGPAGRWRWRAGAGGCGCRTATRSGPQRRPARRPRGRGPARRSFRALPRSCRGPGLRGPGLLEGPTGAQ